jgi:histidine triad (HIT) family protein
LHDPSCIFCKIVRGEIPCARVLETSQTIAFLDINPINKGHTLLVPKAHRACLSDLTESVAAQAGALLPRLCRAVTAAAGSDGINVIVNNGQAAGQTVDHCHFHVVPRFKNDSVRWPWVHGAYAGDELSQMRERIEHELNVRLADELTEE